EKKDAPEAAQQVETPSADQTPSEEILPEPENLFERTRHPGFNETKHSTLEGGFTVHKFAPYTEDDSETYQDDPLEDPLVEDRDEPIEAAVIEDVSEDVEDAQESSSSRAP